MALSNAKVRRRSEEVAFKFTLKLIIRFVTLRIKGETFLLRALERLELNDFLRIITDQAFIHPNLQLRLAGDRNQPFTNTRLRSLWNALTTDDYNQISNSFFFHMRFKAKRTRAFSMRTIQQFFRTCRTPPRTTKVPSTSLPDAISQPTTPTADASRQKIDENHIAALVDTAVSNNSLAPEQVGNETTEVAPTTTFHETRADTLAYVDTISTISSLSTVDPHAQEASSSSSMTPLTTTVAEKKQEPDPILILLDIVDNASVNSGSTNGYATSMTSSIGSNSNISRSYRQYDSFENRYHRGVPAGSHPSNTNSNHASSTTTSTSFHHNSYNQPKQRHGRQQQQHQQHDFDNDSTTSSNTGYISTMSNSHISISGSVASV